GVRRPRAGPRADGAVPGPVPAGGHPEPPGEPDDDVVDPAGRSLLAHPGLGRGLAGRLPAAPRALPDLQVEGCSGSRQRTRPVGAPTERASSLRDAPPAGVPY